MLVCKVVKVVVSDDGTRKETVKANMSVEKATRLRDKLDTKVMKEDFDTHTGVVAYIVEGIVN